MKKIASTAARPSVTFYGAAQAVTGSMHLLEVNRQRFLLDCGLVLGPGSQIQERNRHFPFEPEDLEAVLLSHAHVDHCGNLPNLVRQGFKGPIYCTPPTCDLLAIMLADSARIQEHEAGGSDAGPLYTTREVDQTLRQCVSVPYDRKLEIGTGARMRFLEAGHLLGSAMIEITAEAEGDVRTITYTGDLGRADLNFLRAPAPLPASDLIVCESTYGGRTHQTMEVLSRTLQDVVCRTVDRGGKILVPAFSLGRAQLVVHHVQRWMAEGLLPHIPIHVDGPIAADVAEVHRLYPTSLTASAQAALPATQAEVQYARSRQESRALSRTRGSCVLVASGGMCQAGRVLTHLEHHIDDPRNSIVLVSYQAPGSLGRRLLDRGPTVRFRNKMLNKWADIIDVSGFSGHADQQDFLNHFRPLLPQRPQIHLVHGEYEQSHALALALEAEGFDAVDIPRREDRFLVA